MTVNLTDWIGGIGKTTSSRARREQLLDVVLLGLGILAIIGLLVEGVFGIMGKLDNVKLIYGKAAILASTFIIHAINRRHSSAVASSLFLLILTFTLSIVDSPRQLVEGRSLFLFTIPILMASFLVRPWASLLMAVVSSGIISTIAWVHLEDYAQGAPPIPSMLGFFAVGFVSWLSAQNVEDALNSLREVNHELDQRVEDRTQDLRNANRCLEAARSQLEQRVKARTAELLRANQQLESEVRMRHNVEQVLHQRSRQLDQLNEAARAFTTSLDLDAVLSTVLKWVGELIDASNRSVWLIDSSNHDKVYQVIETEKGSEVSRIRHQMAHRLIAWIMTHQQTLHIADVSQDPRYNGPLNQADEEQPGALVMVPLKVKHKLVGILQVTRSRPHTFDTTDTALLELLSAPAAIAIENARLYKDAQREITERIRAESALKESEARYRTLIDMSPDSFILTDLAGSCLMCNQQTAKMMEAANVEELLGMNVLDLVHEEERAEAKLRMRRTMIAGASYNNEYRVTTLQGNQFQAEINAALLRDSSGKPDGIIALTRDLTERKNAEKALKRSNDELRAVNAITIALNTHPDLSEGLRAVAQRIQHLLPELGIWLHIFPSKATNAQEILIQKKTKNREEFRQSRDKLEEAVRHLEAAAAMVSPGDEPKPIAIDEDSNRFSAHMIGIPLKAQRGVIGTLGAVSSRHMPSQYDVPPTPESHADGFVPADLRFLRAVSWQVALAVENIRLTQEAAEAQALRDLERMRSDLIANFSHGLKTPLGLIKMSCTTLMREDADFDTKLQAEILQDIDTQADRLETIVGRMLDLGQLESGHMRFKRRVVDLSTLVESVVAITQKPLTDHRIRFDLPKSPIPVAVDTKRIEEVIHNLLDNAVKYSPEGGDIRVTVEEKGDNTVVSVEDRGLGIPKEDLTRVFERFYRVENDMTRGINGVGLGLAVSRGIVRAHRGRIWAERNNGPGTTFRFTLPIAERDRECHQNELGVELDDTSENPSVIKLTDKDTQHEQDV